MFWVTLTTADEKELLDAVTFLIQENGRYCLLLMDGTQREGDVKDIQFLHIERVIDN